MGFVAVRSVGVDMKAGDLVDSSMPTLPSLLKLGAVIHVPDGNEEAFAKAYLNGDVSAAQLAPHLPRSVTLANVGRPTAKASPKPAPAKAPEPEPPVAEPDSDLSKSQLSTFRKGELVAKAEELGLDVDGMSKAEVVDAILENQG